ncbi:response regulator transcription factor [Candidatus Mcinerneyibacteriota bacterium]|nr:response regulator transcription factor [Candidatus Mcinerneyibacteriota bacterium]
MDDTGMNTTLCDFERMISQTEYSSKTKNVVLVSKVPILMESIKNVFPSDYNIGCFSNVDSKVHSLLENKKIDLVIIDICYYCHERSAAESFQKTGNIVLLLEPDTIICIEKLMNNKIKGIISKKEKIDEISKAVNQILDQKKMYVSKCVIEDYFNLIPNIRYLSDRETVILQLLGQGKKPAGIAQDLFISVKTVETYRYKIMDKLDISDSENLYLFASFFSQRYLALDQIFPCQH